MHQRIDDIDVHFRAEGNGAALVFIHGLAEDHRSWARQQEAITDRRTYAYDFRGHGRTTIGDANGTLDQLASDLIGFLQEVSGPATCVGFSLGGTIVLAAAARRPDLMPQAIVLGTSSVVGRSAAQFYRERIALSEHGEPDAFSAALREDTAGALRATPHVDAVTASRLDAIGSGAGYRNAAAAMARLNQEPLTPTLRFIRVPVVVVGGDQDTFCPRKAADIMLEALPNATYREIANAGHLMNVDQPDSVTRTIREHLLARSDV